ncbi:MAG: ribbon-helix-helix protein, CopG family [Verrucomicrobiota bacterium]
MANAQGIRLGEETQKRLKWLAEQKDRSMNYLIKEAINRYLEDEERFEREKAEDQKRLQHFLDTGEHITHAKMKGKLKKLLAKAQKAAS